MTPSIVHLGLGAFARGHLAVYAEDLGLEITGVSLRHDDVRRALEPTGFVYQLEVVDGDDVRSRTIHSVVDVLHAPTQRTQVRAALAAPTTTIISVTVTEKGYNADPATLAHDLAHPDEPETMPGHLVLAMADRRAAGAPPPTVLSLDNLSSNGRLLRRVVLDMASHNDPSLAEWIDAHVAFPCSMVDRIVPALTDPTGRTVRAEPYSQWVVERAWSSPMPPLETVGVTVVDDVAPWETLKLRILNGMHTSAAHFGLRHGLATVDQVVAHPAGRRLLERVAAETAEVLEPPRGVDVPAYIATTLHRFANSALGHRCAQIATDTSQKLPQRLLATVRLRLERGLPIDAIADVLALWAWCTVHKPARDPLEERLAEIAGDTTKLLSLEPIFGDLAGNPVLVEAVAERLIALTG
jgi:fructuronate reductase